VEGDEMSRFDRLRAAWTGGTVRINHGAPLAAVESFEARHAVTLPLSFRNYILEIGGMIAGQTDNSVISFLSLDAIDREMKPLAQSSELREIAFAEFLVFSHCYVLKCTKEGLEKGVFAADGTHEKHIAPTFDQFVDAYLDNPQGIAHCM
jgi:hypothetical protein